MGWMLDDELGPRRRRGRGDALPRLRCDSQRSDIRLSSSARSKLNKFNFGFHF